MTNQVRKGKVIAPREGEPKEGREESGAQQKLGISEKGEVCEDRSPAQGWPGEKE